MNQSSCLLCGSLRTQEIFEWQDYPLFVGTVPKGKRGCIPRIPLKIGLCENCGFIMQIDPPVELLQSIYEDFYSFPSPVLTGIGSRSGSNFLSFIMGRSGIRQGKALEIGSFDGYFLDLLKQEGFEVYGCEPSYAADIAISRLGIPTKKEFFRGGLFENDSFDLVVFRHLLEHFEDPIPKLNTTRTILKSHAFLAIAVPNVEFSLIEGVIGDFFHQHISYFSPKTLEHMLNVAGFKVICLEECGYEIYCIAEKSGDIQTNNLSAERTQNVVEYVQRYKRQVESLKKRLELLINALRSAGKRLAIFGAGGHTTGLMLHLGLSASDISLIFDNDVMKHGKLLAGFDIEVKSPVDILSQNIDVIIVSSQIYQDEIIEQLRPVIKKGIKVVRLYPVPEYV